MDGNGRWAQLRKHPRTYGHIKGARVAKKIITQCSKRGFDFLTLYAFSAENWLRPEGEVSLLMKLLKRYLKRETENLIKENIRFEIIGDTKKLPIDVLEAVEIAHAKTAHCTGLTVIFALSYGSRQEITRAVQDIIAKVQSGEIPPNEVNEAVLDAHLYTADFSDPDLVIRTSGEERLSNFLLWQSAYSELYFTKTLWPDFTEADLELAIENFESRQRRFGTLVQSKPPTSLQNKKSKEDKLNANSSH